MDYLTDFTILFLTAGLVPGGLALGQRVGAVAACWGAAGAWIALRFADRMWRPVFVEMRGGDPALDLDFWLPVSFGLLFAGMFLAVVGLIAWVKPRPREFVLPGQTGDLLALAAGGAAGALVLLALVQSQVMTASAEKRMPRALEWARPVLAALGQERLAPAKPAAGAPAAGQRGTS